MYFIQKQHIPKALSFIQAVEFLAEYLGKSSEKRIYTYFLALEVLKLLVKLRKWALVDKCGLMISENNNYSETDYQEDEAAIQFQQNLGSLEYNPSAVNEKSIKDELKSIKDPIPKFNLGYYDVIQDKQTSLLTMLPIPNNVKQKDYQSKLNQLRIQIGEILHLFRPLIYCALILKYGGDSYTPYFISFFIDILRLLIEFRIKIYRKSQKEELAIRAKEAIICYILRNPFYGSIVKQIILSNTLGKVFNQQGWIYRLIIALIELRSSKCLLL
ncbi:unnamed protein product (macronuclear) [Paramecium tetraurelia]|uniref:Peroxisomal membrane protein PEX16 n=1 Tax=Paramecium tetraurelia TaxID=5888 RepID=A0C9I3_PARTE|nr:uncharacterized protein GSPATT00006756001 [Paramecium tetraurelia]CAK67450.1 unnamed protein product [Paramecium tetraurelia]|eukprot:XP_001434847.1 hypothetical protein (macronuclear) [Paramecium tetraurelia strain d4-2]